MLAERRLHIVYSASTIHVPKADERQRPTSGRYRRPAQPGWPQPFSRLQSLRLADIVAVVPGIFRRAFIRVERLPGRECVAFRVLVLRRKPVGRPSVMAEPFPVFSRGKACDPAKNARKRRNIFLAEGLGDLFLRGVS